MSTYPLIVGIAYTPIPGVYAILLVQIHRLLQQPLFHSMTCVYTPDIAVQARCRHANQSVRRWWHTWLLEPPHHPTPHARNCRMRTPIATRRRPGTGKRTARLQRGRFTSMPLLRLHVWNKYRRPHIRYAGPVTDECTAVSGNLPKSRT